MGMETTSDQYFRMFFMSDKNTKCRTVVRQATLSEMTNMCIPVSEVETLNFIFTNCPF